jgi:hypothetical protein
VPILPPIVAQLMAPFRNFFTAPVWSHVLVLIAGATLAPGKRTVCSALRVMGLGANRDFALYHHVLSRASWSARAVARKLLALIVDRFVPDGPVVMGLDDTIERRLLAAIRQASRRWGARIAARGIYRDPVRSSEGHFVKASGLRWLALMALVPVPWAKRRWALPFLTVLAPSKRYNTSLGRRHKTLTDWARQAILQVRRWLPDRNIIVTADSSFAALELIETVRRHVTFITRLRLDAALYAPPSERNPNRRGRPAKRGVRVPKLSQVLEDEATMWTKLSMPYWYGGERCVLEIRRDACLIAASKSATGTSVWYSSGLPPAHIRWVLVRDPDGRREPQAFLCTGLDAAPEDILGWFVQRWSVETTFQECRRHVGIETQRQWSSLAIARTTPVLFGLFSLITLWAADPNLAAGLRPRTAVWYAKAEPSFSDAIALVRRHFWAAANLSASRSGRDTVEIPTALLERLTGALCYAA